MDRWLVIALAACGGDTPPATPDSGVDAAVDAGVSSPCTGACAQTALTAQFQVTRVLDQAVYGVNGSDATLHVEVHRNGDGACPTQNSPTPDYTLVLGSVPSGTVPTTSPGNILDFVGDLLGGPLGAQATTVAITPVAMSANEFVALDVDLAFQAGSVVGHLYAMHCNSLDSQ